MVVLIGITFPGTTASELFPCVLAIYISLCEQCLLTFVASVLTGCLFVAGVRSSLCGPDTSSWPGARLPKVSSNVAGCLFHLVLLKVIRRANVFHLEVGFTFFFSCMFRAFLFLFLYPKKLRPTQGHKGFLPCFSSTSFVASCFAFRPVMHLKVVLVYVV